MLGIFKRLFGKKKEEEYIPDPPGRTFNRVVTGKYFGCEDIYADENRIVQAKKKKIDQIAELGLVPKFTRYSYEDIVEYHPDPEASSVYVVFQKEVSAQKGNMTHITEISFILNRSDFDEFEKMSGLSLSGDFRDLSSNENSIVYNGKDRRKKKRDLIEVS